MYSVKIISDKFAYQIILWVIQKYRENWRQLRPFISKCFKALIMKFLIFFFSKPILRFTSYLPIGVDLHLNIVGSQETPPSTFSSAILTSRKSAFLMICREKKI